MTQGGRFSELHRMCRRQWLNVIYSAGLLNHFTGASSVMIFAFTRFNSHMSKFGQNIYLYRDLKLFVNVLFTTPHIQTEKPDKRLPAGTWSLFKQESP